MRKTVLSTFLVLSAALSLSAQNKDPKKQGVFTSSADAGPDFIIQGEYASQKHKYGAQIVALGDGKFDVYFLAGGLPGAGWDGKTRIKAPAATTPGKTTITGEHSGVIDDGWLTVNKLSGQTVILKKVERKSPTAGEAPPRGAVVLFDGKNADEWSGGKVVENNLLFCGTSSKKGFGLGKLHIEFRTPFQPKARGQGRGNSGVYIHNNHEIQVLDSFGLKGENNECGGFYGHAKPIVNMCFPPLSWQTYDVEVKSGAKTGELLATVWHNGVKIHDNHVIKASGKPASINLQNHGNPVVYRNIWILPEERK